MTSQHAISDAGLALIKRYEPFCPRPVQLADGRWMIGYGHVTDEPPPEQRLREAEAVYLLQHDLKEVAGWIERVVYAPLSQGQFDALSSLAFHLGEAAFARSEVVRRLNEGLTLEAADAFGLYAGAMVSGEARLVDALARRRAAERALFLDPAPGQANASRGFLPVADPIEHPDLARRLQNAPGGAGELGGIADGDGPSGRAPAPDGWLLAGYGLMAAGLGLAAAFGAPDLVQRARWALGLLAIVGGGVWLWRALGGGVRGPDA